MLGLSQLLPSLTEIWFQYCKCSELNKRWVMNIIGNIHPYTLILSAMVSNFQISLILYILNFVLRKQTKNMLLFSKDYDIRFYVFVSSFCLFRINGFI